MDLVAAVNQAVSRSGEMVLVTMSIGVVAVLAVTAASAWLQRKGF